jgi:hypothetical protein
VPAAPGCLPLGRPVEVRDDRALAFFFVYGLSDDDDGLDEFVLSFPSWRSSSATLSVSTSICPISRSTSRACP